MTKIVLNQLVAEIDPDGLLKNNVAQYKNEKPVSLVNESNKAEVIEYLLNEGIQIQDDASIDEINKQIIEQAAAAYFDELRRFREWTNSESTYIPFRYGTLCISEEGKLEWDIAAEIKL